MPVTIGTTFLVGFHCYCPLLQGVGSSKDSRNGTRKHIKSEDFFMISGWCFQRSPICFSIKLKAMIQLQYVPVN